MTVIDLGRRTLAEIENDRWLREFKVCDRLWDYETGKLRHSRHCRACAAERDRLARLKQESMWTRPLDPNRRV